MKQSIKEDHYLTSFYESYLSLAPRLTISDFTKSYKVAHRHVARILYCLDQTDNLELQVRNLELMDHIYLWEISLVQWCGDYRINPYTIYKQICTENNIEMFSEKDLKFITDYDFYILDNECKYLKQSYDILGIENISTHTFKKYIEQYIS